MDHRSSIVFGGSVPQPLLLPLLHHQLPLHAPFSSDSNNPFAVLGLPRNSSYQSVKEKFLKLAMEHHPDRQTNNHGRVTTSATNTNHNNTSSDHFVRIRQAFEVIREGHNGTAVIADEPQWTEDELQAFMTEHTHHFLSFHMDTATRHDVVDAFHKLSPGGLDRGGTWEMARMLAEREACSIEDHHDPPTKQVTDGGSSTMEQHRRRRKR